VFLNFQVYFQYILFQSKYVFLKNSTTKNIHSAILVNPEDIFYMSIHIKLSSVFYLNQLVDITSYENSLVNSNLTLETLSDNNKINIDASTIGIYNFQSLLTTERYFLFTTMSLVNYIDQKQSISSNKFGYKNMQLHQSNVNNKLLTISELFSAAN
jgi:hypothetical protein